MILPPPESLEKMPGGEVLSFVAEAIAAEATKIRGSQDALVSAGFLAQWDESRLCTYAALDAAADVILRLVQEAKAKKQAGEKPKFTTLQSADIARSALIRGATREKKEAADVEV